MAIRNEGASGFFVRGPGKPPIGCFAISSFIAVISNPMSASEQWD
jgi:hypothetical protein